MAKVTEVEPDYTPFQSIMIIVDDGPTEGTYETVVHSVNDDSILIRVPQVNQLFLPLESGQEIKLMHYEAAAEFKTDTRISKRLESQGNPIIVVDKPEVLTRIQRRTFLRVPCSFDTEINILKNPSSKSLPRTLSGKVIDISGGGVKLDVRNEEAVLPEKAEVELNFTLPHSKKEMSEIFARIIRVIEDDSKPGYFAATKFVGLTDNQRHDIIQYVFKRQRELNKRK